MKNFDITTLKMNILGGMNEYIKEMGDEELWERWITIVPDECTEDDLLYIAEDEGSWRYVCDLFGRLVGAIKC